MQKIISINVIKQMLPVIKSKFKTKLDRKINDLTKKYEDQVESSFFKKSMPTLSQIKREALYEGICGLHYDKSFIENLELCIRNSGDVILTENELSFLYSRYEEKV